ncbi:MAG: SDR family NAD(P)-dependent oxidoreductase [Chloroflexi bacterium]|nr:SDR family NAD(P)-dependent oxidoreductase [Chloroflexota bacterium]
MTTRIGPGTRAIVTGASWGIGETFAHSLAARGADLLLVARTETRLLTIASDLAARYNVRVEIVTVDLAALDGPRRLCEAVDALGFAPTLLVNNAGYGQLGPFSELPLARAREMIRLNMSAVVALTRLILPGMLERGCGAIVNVASASAFQPLPNYAVYAASKAFLLNLSAALWAECRHKGVQVVAVCPGAVDATPADERQPRRLLRKATREIVVERALAAVERDVPVVVPSAITRVSTLGLALLPRRARLRLAGALIERFPAAFTGIRRRDASTTAPLGSARS